MVQNRKIQAIVGHVAIEVTDLNKSKKFYQSLLNGLGFEVIMDNGNAVGFSNQTFQVWLAKPEKKRIKRESPTGEEFIVADHIAILVPDRESVDAAAKNMKKSGFEALFPCEEYPEFCPGYYAVSFSDPDNFVIEIYTRPQRP
jgi:catechol 2,3-dioxygenase-like lactoylglutathione lyase family enzyme